MRVLLRLAAAGRLVLWGLLSYGVWAGSRVVLVCALAVVFFAIELLVRTSPVAVPLSRTGSHRRSSDAPEG